MPLEFYSPETFGFLGFLAIPHLAWARALLLWGLKSFITSERWFGALLAGLLWLLMGFFQPLVIVIGWAILGAYLLGLLIWTWLHQEKDWTSLRGWFKRALLVGLGLAGAMITEYPLEARRYDQPEYEPFWAAAEALGMPLSLHTATRRQGKIRGAGERTIRDATSRSTKAFYPAISMCDMIFSGVFERHPGLRVAIVEFELAWAPHVLSSMDYTYRERHEEALYRFKDGMRPSDFFHRNVFLSFQEDAIGIRLRDAIGVDNLMWGSDYPHSESTFPQSRKILAEILAGVPEEEQAKIAGANTARLYGFDVARLGAPTFA